MKILIIVAAVVVVGVGCLAGVIALDKAFKDFTDLF